MDYIFDKLTGIVYGILVLLIIVLIIGVVYVLLSKKKRKTRIDEDTTDYSTFERRDTQEYVKNIKDIRDDMIIVDDGTRFVAVIRCHGFDFYDEDYEVQLQTAQGYMGFVNTINKPISYRQYSKPVDLEDTLNMYQEALNSVEAELYNAQEDLRDISKVLKTDMESLSEDEKSLYADKIKELEKQINALKFRKFHIEDQMRIIGIFANGAVHPIPEETYVIDYQYESMDLSVNLSDAEIFEKAKSELDARVSAKIHALANAHVKSYRCKTAELIDMCRWYSYPVSAARYKQRDVERSTYFDDIHTSDSLARMNRAALDEARAKNVQAYMEGVAESAEESAKRAIKQLESVYAEAAAEEARMTAGGKAQKKEKPVATTRNIPVRPTVAPVRPQVTNETAKTVSPAGHANSGAGPVDRHVGHTPVSGAALEQSEGIIIEEG
mgnify:CR=1 FL=1